jgi:TonB family protein
MKKCFLLLLACCLFSVTKAQTTDTPKTPPMPANGIDPDGAAAGIDNRIFSVVDDMPRFPGGTDSLHRYLSKKIVYPPKLLKNHIGGPATVQFIVEKDGSLTGFRMLNSPDALISAEVVRVMRNVKFIGGTQRGVPARVAYSFRIHFDPDYPDFF